MNPLSFLYREIAYLPLLNGLIFVYNIVPYHDFGVAIILFTLAVRLAILPLTLHSLRSQKAMTAIQPKLKAIQEAHKNNKEEQAKKTMELYKEHGVNPFSGCLPMIVQLVIFIALYQVFLRGLDASQLDGLYGFINRPESINAVFLGFIDLSLKKNWVLAFLAGASQFYLAHVTTPPPNASAGVKKQNDFSYALSMQMKYFLPVVIFFTALSFSSALSLYWTISNAFGIMQQVWVNKKTNEYGYENQGTN
ncbi:membrane protein insertase YidC [Patescibacteria group bacterium]|nr:membrane protein insertase YidC [Patescibacteria group bacterium]